MEIRSEFLSLPVLIHLLVLRPLLKLVFGVSVEGRQNLAGLERFILVSNHNSHLDVLLLFHLLPLRLLRRTHPVAAYEYFAKPKMLLWLVSFLFQPVWIVREGKESDPLRGMREQLGRGHSLVVFPEGTRGEAGRIAPFKSGVGRLAIEFPDVPIVPVYLAGPERAFPKASSFPVPLWNRVIVGPPLLLTGTRKEITTTLEGMTRELAESEAASRHRRMRRARVVTTLAVLGIDGSGKSTLARALAQHLSRDARTCLITDDVVFFEGGKRREVQLLLKERLREAIGRRAKSAGSLKSYKIPKLAELLLRDRMVEEVRRWYAPDLIVMDGAPLLNITAWAKLYRDEAFDESICASILRILTGRDDEVGAADPVFDKFPELVTLKRLYLAKLELPDTVLFLDVDPRVSMERIRSRGEKQQVHETKEKLGKLREGYRLVGEVVERDLGVPARALDGPLPIEAVIENALGELGRMSGPKLDQLRELGGFATEDAGG